MLGDKRWYAKLDDSTTTWYLLELEEGTSPEGPYLSAWRAGKANAHQIIETNSMEIESAKREPELLQELMGEFAELRYQFVTVITLTSTAMPKLRSALLTSTGFDSTLRGFYHVSIEQILSNHFCVDYFDDEDALLEELRYELEEKRYDGKHDSSSHQLWSLVKKIGPLVPRKAVMGDLL